MAWVQVASSPVRWQRPIGENERMIKWLGDRSHSMGREHWSVTAIGSFALRSDAKDETGGSVTPSTAALRRAWMLLRFQHPSIAATAGEHTIDYVVPDKAILENWVDETLHIVSDTGISAEDVVATLRPSPYTEGYFLPHTQQFVLHTAHWRTDGYGILHLLNAFFDALASVLPETAADPATALAWGEEHTRLAPAVEELLGIPETPTPAIRAAAAECLATTALAAGSVGLPWRREAKQPGGTRGVRRTLAEPATKAVLAACEARGLRLRAAVHASLAAANFLAAERKQQEQYYTSTMRFTLRPYIPSLAPNSPRHAAGLYTGGYFARVSDAQTWQDHAAQYEALYAAGLSSDFLIARRQYAAEALERFQALAAATGAGAGAGKAPPPRSEIDISAVDDAEQLVAPARPVTSTHGSEPSTGGEGADGANGHVLEVLDLSLGVECLAQETYLFLWTFRGRIEFHFVYNEAFYDAEYMAEMLRLVESVLLKELHVDTM
ncbi:uncharacterized protein THITE_2145716 [Thermothielavioides terrestris NRRL 8126]|uniref:Condensation domain-containing protein n=1 Tax=Thermothielavioides terrestris (strain ATCC 38088 / NRRL 8126) TaxID=578455 RepID=G2R8V0_THETT|nr:uncharacterized protein THITE_2145716 [Thermothielavioides terrestris NRRL 8126]AEO68599.1 hypothetical protein THITE_2145716 [Thermothielavioides terrestris NRRL 8126]